MHSSSTVSQCITSFGYEGLWFNVSFHGGINGMENLNVIKQQEKNKQKLILFLLLLIFLTSYLNETKEFSIEIFNKQLKLCYKRRQKNQMKTTKIVDFFSSDGIIKEKKINEEMKLIFRC